MRSQQRAAEAYRPKNPFRISTSRTISSHKVLTPRLPLRLGHPLFSRRSITRMTAVSQPKLTLHLPENRLSYLCPDLRSQIPRTGNNSQTSCSTRPNRPSKEHRLWACHTPTCRDMCPLRASTRTLPLMGKSHLHPSLELLGEVGRKNIQSSGQVRHCSRFSYLLRLYNTFLRANCLVALISFFIIMLRDLISCCVPLGQKFSFRWRLYPLCTILPSMIKMVYHAVRWTYPCYRLTSSLIPLELLATFACLSILRLAILRYRTSLADHIPFHLPPSYLHHRLCLFVIFFFPRQPWSVNTLVSFFIIISPLTIAQSFRHILFHPRPIFDLPPVDSSLVISFLVSPVYLLFQKLFVFSNVPSIMHPVFPPCGWNSILFRSSVDGVRQ